MKLCTILLAILGIAHASWLDQSPLIAPSTVEDKSLSVPGENPLFYCASPSDYILSIDDLELSPNPPEQGKNLTIRATGQLSETIKNGSRAFVTVKWGFVSLISKTFDLCDNAGIIGKECPLEKGALEVLKEVAIPDPIPPGKYVVAADVFTDDEANGGKRITCLTGSIQF